MTKQTRLLIIRLSSFGDIIQASAIPAAFRAARPEARIDWLVRADFAGLLTDHPLIDKVVPFDRRRSAGELLRLAWRLARDEGYTHVYDAHSNVRSHLVVAIFRLQALLSLNFARRHLVRPKSRWKRWLFFRLRLPTLPRPYRGAESFLWPLTKWRIPAGVPAGPQFTSSVQLPGEIAREVARLPRPRIALAPSAAWALKRWPAMHWRSLIREMPEASFVLLGGPEDGFIAEIANAAPDRCLNLAGRLRLEENPALLKEVDLVIANDTGLLHVSDQMNRPTLALIGPTAFGYPSHPSSRTLEIDLPCKPCSKDGRDRCRNSIYQRCLVELAPARVAEAARERLLQALPVEPTLVR